LTWDRRDLIVILVSSTLRSKASRIGAAIGASPGAIVLVGGLLFGSPGSVETTIGVGLSTVVLGAVLGWLFAPSVAVGDSRSVLSTTAEMTIIAVPLGALGVAASLIGVRILAGEIQGLDAGQTIVGTLGLTFVGLLVLGLPLAGITFGVVSVWAGLVRLALGRLSNDRV
jgi:hypothetical protein